MRTFLLLPLLLMLTCAGCVQSDLVEGRPTAYQAELAAMAAGLDGISANSGDPLKQVYYLYRRASLTGNFHDYRVAVKALAEAGHAEAPSLQWHLFNASLNLRLHRLDAAEVALQAVDDIGGSHRAEIIRADVALQRGQYAVAETAYEALCAENPGWDDLARLAYYRAHTGAPDRADELYAEAQELLSAKELRDYAWLELQRGILDFDHSRDAEALEHYLRAERAYSGYWLVREHIAEVYARLDRRREAIALYRQLIEQTGHPELIDALATLLAAGGAPEAELLYRQADAGFADNYAMFPEAAGGHIIAALLGRTGDEARILAYARENYRIRPNAEAALLLAKAHDKLGDPEQAGRWLQQVLATPWRTPEVEVLAGKLGLRVAGRN